MAGLGIVNTGTNKKDFAKVIKQSPPVESGMYKAVFNRFVTIGFQEDAFNDGEIKFKSIFGYELVEDMAGNKVDFHVKEFDDGTKEEGPKSVFREYPVKDELHHKSNAFGIAKALDPAVPTIRRGKDKEHEYIVNFDWEKHLGGTVLLQIAKKKSKSSENFYNQITNVLPLGMPLEQKSENTFFNLYDGGLKEVFDTKVFPWERKQIAESIVVPGEPDVIYRGDTEVPAKEDPIVEPPVDYDDDIPF